MVERRRAPRERRHSRRAPFVASVRQRAGGGTQLALAQNLGEDGMELRRLPATPAAPAGEPPRLPSGEPRAAVARLASALDLSFELPDGGALVRVRAAVVFERKDGPYHTTGIRFASISPADRARIASYLRRR